MSEHTRQAMVPTPRTLWLRRYLPWQLVRFVLINLRMMKMIRLSHAHPIDPE